MEQGGYKDLIELDGAFATMWKKQIFTEAEMVAQAEGIEAKELAKTLPREEDLIQLVDGDESMVQESPRDGSKAGEHKITSATATGHNSHIEGYEMMTDTAEPSVHADKLVQPGVSYADMVKVADKAADGDVEPQKAADPAQTAPDSSTPDAQTIRQSGDALTNTGKVVESPSEDPTAVTTPAPASPERFSGQLPTRGSSGKVPFPDMPRMNTSASQRSDLSAQVSDNNVGETSSPSGSNNPSTTDLPDLSKEKEDKRRKRLSSLKGFVRRISDQGVSRSNSLKNLSGSPRHTPTDEVDEATALIAKNTTGADGASPASAQAQAQGDDKRKKRISLVRGKSDR